MVGCQGLSGASAVGVRPATAGDWCSPDGGRPMLQTLKSPPALSPAYIVLSSIPSPAAKPATLLRNCHGMAGCEGGPVGFDLLWVQHEEPLLRLAPGARKRLYAFACRVSGCLLLGRSVLVQSPQPHRFGTRDNSLVFPHCASRSRDGPTCSFPLAEMMLRARPADADVR